MLTLYECFSVIESSSLRTKELEANLDENGLQSECLPDNIETHSYFRTSVRVCCKREYDVFPIFTSKVFGKANA
jgi:hypothetical protein